MKASKSAGVKASTKVKAPVKASQTGAILYSFKNGVLTTCEIPSLRLEIHKKKFASHRCGYFNGKFYFLDSSWEFSTVVPDPLMTNSSLRVYDPNTKKIEKEFPSCKCNFGPQVPLLVKAMDVIDLGPCPRSIKTSGERSFLPRLQCLDEIANFAVCSVGKLIYIAGGDDPSLYDLEEGVYDLQGNRAKPPLLEVMKSEIYVINCNGYTWSQLQPRITPRLYNISLIPLPSNEILVLGEDESSTVAYRLRDNSLIKEGESKRSLGRCCSSTVLNGVLFMFFDSGYAVTCTLKTGLMRAYNLLRFLHLKTRLWVFERTPFRRLNPNIVKEVFSSY